MNTEPKRWNRKIVSVGYLPKLNKFRVCLECGHTIVCDHSVSNIKAMRTVACTLCEKGKPV